MGQDYQIITINNNKSNRNIHYGTLMSQDILKTLGICALFL